MQYQLIDLKTDAGDFWKNKFFQMVDSIDIESKDRLKQNYVHLKFEYQNFDVFNLLTFEENILAFSGMMSSFYPKTISRILMRTYYTKDLRIKNLRKRSFPSLASQYMLPYQVAHARSLGKTGVFLSMHGIRRRYLEMLAKQLNSYYNQDWKVLDGVYNTCRLDKNGKLNSHPSCWQHVLALFFNNSFQFPLPRIGN